jgi:hypothetical protein
MLLYLSVHAKIRKEGRIIHPTYIPTAVTITVFLKYMEQIYEVGFLIFEYLIVNL